MTAENHLTVILVQRPLVMTRQRRLERRHAGKSQLGRYGRRPWGGPRGVETFTPALRC
jgi:hypothetical protein